MHCPDGELAARVVPATVFEIRKLRLTESRDINTRNWIKLLGDLRA
jgi:hypothetical protein